MSRRISEIYQSPWLSAVDLRGQRVTVTIAGVDVRTFKQRDGTAPPKVVVRFHGKEKQLVLNQTQARELAALFGDEIDAWPGHAIAMWGTLASNGRETISVGAPTA